MGRSEHPVSVNDNTPTAMAPYERLTRSSPSVVMALPLAVSPDALPYRRLTAVVGLEVAVVGRPLAMARQRPSTSWQLSGAILELASSSSKRLQEPQQNGW